MKTHPIAWMVRPKDAPMFDQRAIEIRLEDEAAGPFVVVKIQLDEVKPGEISIDPSEWADLRAAIDTAVWAANDISKDTEEKQ